MEMLRGTYARRVHDCWSRAEVYCAQDRMVSLCQFGEATGNHVEVVARDASVNLEPWLLSIATLEDISGAWGKGGRQQDCE